MVVDLDFVGKYVNYVVLGYSYNDSEFIFMVEMVMLDVEWSVLGNLVYGYVSIGYIWGDFIFYLIFVMINIIDKCNVIEEFDYVEVIELIVILGFVCMYFGY